MKIIIFSHPDFIGSQSMLRYTQWIVNGMQKRGHIVEVWKPRAFLYKMPCPGFLKKWLGYLDQYLVFPIIVRYRLMRQSNKNALYVFSDHALGPWMPLVVDKCHIVHCHDFLAQRSALGAIPENPTGFTGRCYQAFIRRGYRKAQNFISISRKTQEDLHRFLEGQPLSSSMVYNGLTRNCLFAENVQRLRNSLSKETGLPLNHGFLLHVGGNQWYKNRCGVVLLYDTWRRRYGLTLPLIFTGQKPDKLLSDVIAKANYKEDIFIVQDANDVLVEQLYSAASVFLFPSLAEGFGWPIIEAMALGTLVITTEENPMTEVGDEAAYYLRKMPVGNVEVWLNEGADLINRVVSIPEDERVKALEKGRANTLRFNSDSALNQIESIYLEIMKGERK